MKGIKIIALTELGQKNIDDTKQEYARWMVKHALDKLKIKLSFTANELMIENPAFMYCDNLDHPKAKKGMDDIRKKYSQIGAVEGKDYKIKVID